VRIPRGAHRYIALNKPRGVLSDRSSGGVRRTVFDLVDDSDGLYPVGRLDLESEGLILLTDDGELALHLSHPRYEHEKEYDVLVAGEPDEETLERWRGGIVLADPEGREPTRRTAPARVDRGATEPRGTWLRIVMREGRKRQIRRVAQVLGHPAIRIVRTRIGPIRLGRLRAGESRALSPEEIRLLERVKRE
jgi:23S rRNA pseudouridine2605 synthase